jgi:tetratricopeptide (TPR) repeat protein/CHAT domain-containing protein
MRRKLPRRAAVGLALIVVATCCLLVGAARARADDVNILYKSMTALYQAGKYAEALPLGQRYAAMIKSRYGSEAAQYTVALVWLAELHRAAGRFAEAEPLLKQALAIDEKLGGRRPEVATDLNNLAELLRTRGRYAEAEPLYKRVLAIDEKALGPEHPDVGTALNNLARLYDDQGRYADAEQLYKRALAIAEKAPGHANLGTYLNNLASLYRNEGRYAEAEPPLKRALAITEKAVGPNHPDFSKDLYTLGLLYRDQGRYGEAEPVMKRALAIAEKALGPEHPDVVRYLNNLATLYHTQGRYTEAVPLMRRVLGLDEKAFGSDHPNVASDLNNLASAYCKQGAYVEAEPLYKRALAIAEKAFGPEHPDVGAYLNSLASLYNDEGRYAEAEPLLKRALVIAQQSLGPDHADVAVRLNNLAFLYDNVGRYSEAEPLYKRALAIDEKALGPDHPTLGTALNNLAALYDDQGRYSEAEQHYKRALAIFKNALGPNHPDVGIDLNNLAVLYRTQGRYAEAEPLLKRALAIAEQTFDPDHPLVGRDLNNLGLLYLSEGDWARAEDFLRRGIAVLVQRMRRGTQNVGQAMTGKRKSETVEASVAFSAAIKAASRLVSEQHNVTGLLSEMFQIAQWAQSSEAAESLAQMAARGAKSDPKLAAFVRERQDLIVEWQRRDQARSSAVAQASDRRNREAESENVARLAAIDARIAVIDKELAVQFPDYAALVSPAPLSVEDVQAMLAADEALVLFLDTPEVKPLAEETFIWVVTKTDSRWIRSDFGTPTLSREVEALRCGLDYAGAWVGPRCADLLKIDYTRVDHTLGKPLPFDLDRAHQLYRTLFGQVEDLIRNKRLLIAPSGALTQLPFQVLVAEPAETTPPEKFSGYRDVAWLTRRHAITILPAVSSLKALRELAKESRATEPYIGFGDPLLDGDPAKFADDAAAAMLAREKRCDPTPGQHTASLPSLRGGSRVVSRGNGGAVDVADLRTWAPLPETADEVCDVAHDLRVDPATHVYLGAAATETKIKQLSEAGILAKHKIMHFATHGAVAGEISNATEPGLLLTPPDKASEIDDGYLSASDIAGLKLDADWVILSACNTAAGNAKGAESLSGLARAFFYAGARSLLVSHWEVASEPTVKLITKAVSELKRDPKIGRAEALRRSMLSMINTGKDYEAHPAFWAPFVLVGEGGAAR